jgi:hypothetical protein
MQTLPTDAASQVCVQLSRGALVLRTVAQLGVLTSILGRRRAKRLSTNVAAAAMTAIEYWWRC